MLTSIIPPGGRGEARPLEEVVVHKTHGNDWLAKGNHIERLAFLSEDTVKFTEDDEENL